MDNKLSELSKEKAILMDKLGDESPSRGPLDLEIKLENGPQVISEELQPKKMPSRLS